MYIVPALKSEFRARLGYIGILSVKMIKLCITELLFSFVLIVPFSIGQCLVAYRNVHLCHQRAGRQPPAICS